MTGRAERGGLQQSLQGTGRETGRPLPDSKQASGKVVFLFLKSHSLCYAEKIRRKAGWVGEEQVGGTVDLQNGDSGCLDQEGGEQGRPQSWKKVKVSRF